MVRAVLVCASLVVAAAHSVSAQPVAPAQGWVVIPVDDYRALRARAFPPEPQPDPPPVDATLTRVEYDLRAVGATVAGEAHVTVDVIKTGWVRVDLPSGLLVRGARIGDRSVAVLEKPAPHVLLSAPGRFVLSLDVVAPVKTTGTGEVLALPASPGAVSRVALALPRDGLDVAVDGGVLVERPQSPDGRWIVYGRGTQPLTITWKRRVGTSRSGLPLRWRGSVTQLLGIGDELSPVTATVVIDVIQGAAPSITLAFREGLSINQVSGALVADWDARQDAVTVTFLEPLTGQTSLAIAGDARIPRDGAIDVPLLRLSGAEREVGGIAVEVLGAAEIGDSRTHGLERADASDLGDALRGRGSPLVAFSYRPQAGAAPRSLALQVARYTPQAVLVANVEEARYEALVGEEGKTLVRARYAVRNNQRSFLAVTLPPDATLWSASTASRAIRPGLGSGGTLLVPLDKARAGEEQAAFVVEVLYLQRGVAWNERGRAVLVLPSIDLPVSRTGLVLHHSPRYRVRPEPGAFRPGEDAGPFTAALRRDQAEMRTEAAASPIEAPAAAAKGAADDLVARYRSDHARTVAGPLPVAVPFPPLGPSLFLLSELTAESRAPSIEFSYKRESRW